MNKPNRHGEMTQAVYTMKTESKIGDNDRGKPKRRQKLTYLTSRRRPVPTTDDDFDAPDHVASEVEDLANDEYFYEQLEKNRPTTERSEEVEEVHEVRPHVNRDVVFVQGKKNQMRGKQRQQMTRLNFPNAPFTAVKDDTYNDYGEMEMPDADVEMHDTFEQNTKEGYMQFPSDNVNQPPIRHKNVGQPHYVPHQRPKCRKKRPIKLNARPAPSTIQSTQIRVNGNKPTKAIRSDEPADERRFERIEITKQFSTPDELHAEIDKIFQLKNANFNKRGHHKSHWELRIMPIGYKTHEE